MNTLWSQQSEMNFKSTEVLILIWWMWERPSKQNNLFSGIYKRYKLSPWSFPVIVCLSRPDYLHLFTPSPVVYIPPFLMFLLPVHLVRLLRQSSQPFVPHAFCLSWGFFLCFWIVSLSHGLLINCLNVTLLSNCAFGSKSSCVQSLQQTAILGLALQLSGKPEINYPIKQSNICSKLQLIAGSFSCFCKLGTEATHLRPM